MRFLGCCVAFLALLAEARAVTTGPKALRQATRNEVVKRMSDRIRSPKRPRASLTPLSCNPDGVQPTFLLVGSDSGTYYDGQFAAVVADGDHDIIRFSTDESSATTFTFNDACNLVTPDSEIANIHESTPYNLQLLYFDPADTISADGYLSAVCSITNDVLGCNIGQTTLLLLVCPALGSALYISDSPTAGCAPIDLGAIYE